MSADNAWLNGYHQAPIIGYHRAPLSQKFGAPRQPNLVALMSVIEMVAPYDVPEAFVGLEHFSHLWLSWQFHHNYIKQAKAKQNETKGHSNERHNDQSDTANANSTTFRPQVRPPRLGGNQKVGVFASRSMYRPSALGLSVVKLERIEVIEGRVLLMISGADMIDGTPIIDIKPYIAYSDAVADAKSGFATAALEKLVVQMTDTAKQQFMQIAHEQQQAQQNADKQPSTHDSVLYHLQSRLIDADIERIKDLIAYDPRPAYRRDEMNTTFIMRYKSVDVSFQLIESGQLQITAVVEVKDAL